MSLLVETEHGAKGNVPVSILLRSVPELPGRASRSPQAELFATVVTENGSMHLERLDLSICVRRSEQRGLTPEQNCSLQFRPILENGGTDFPNPQKQNTIVKL